jgi:peptidyl-prolyl cis-trans isomerase B (cyclophilin B)
MMKYKLILFVIIFMGIIGCSGPKALYLTTVEDVNVPAIVDFQNLTEEADSFIWYFGDGGISRDTSPTHKFYLSGRYPVTLEAYKGGKKGSLTKDVILSPPDDCLVLMRTSYGDMLIELYDATPLHRDNFIKIAEEGFLDSLLFHRVIDGFMIQGGDPNSKNALPSAQLGSGGPGYQIEAELIDSLVHTKGALAAARQGDMVNPDRKSSGSQFYIVKGSSISSNQLKMISRRNRIAYQEKHYKAYEELGGTPQLDGGYTVFGRVVEGLEVIDLIASVETNRSDRPLDNVLIIEVKVIK